ncbi:AbrB/MazE/SpoVT family DNA-binding domain-containing protein [Pseudomonas japonica]|uniref:AbrB/MazE/SpoVT family DNA-binding domain-containing protein n=1 Tax=Pseudomonas japonica TaxID=256466 RepID=UPI0015E2E76C|nr:AbrB/MazE/SpoVT family DNA-binding domain-containing protein [Pseudomonas japonica]MBA1243843.1 AbrB family transcriptional regulator [Pseudomonas japonica]
MATATISSEGQVVIPQQMRVALCLGPGDRVEFVETGKGEFLIIARTKSVKALKGLIRTPDAPISIESMNAAIQL